MGNQCRQHLLLHGFILLGDLVVAMPDTIQVTGIAQADISKLGNGSANPSLRTLRRLAAGMGMQLKLEFVPAAK